MTSNGVLVNMGKYTEDGHLMGRGGWLMPKNAMEFYERYADKIDRFAKLLCRSNDWQEAAQATWAHLFSRPGDNSYFPQAVDYIHYLNLKFAANAEEDIHINAMLAYVKCMVRTKGLLDSKQGDAMFSGRQRTNISMTYENEWTGALWEFSDWLEDERLKSADSMRNDPERIIYLREFLTFVEQRRPDLIPFIIDTENHKLQLHQYKTSLKYRDKREAVLALADEFRGLPISGRKQWHETEDYEEWNNRPKFKRAIRVVGKTTIEMLRLITDSPNGMTVKEAAAIMGTKLSTLSGKATHIRRLGCVVKTGERREDSAVLKATGLPLPPPRQRKEKPPKIAKLQTTKAAEGQG